MMMMVTMPTFNIVSVTFLCGNEIITDNTQYTAAAAAGNDEDDDDDVKVRRDARRRRRLDVQALDMTTRTSSSNHVIAVTSRA